MSIRHGMLALLQLSPQGVYQLRKEFEARTGGTWPVNIGQVYSTMQRLERDGLVRPLGPDGRAEAKDGVERYALTDAGRREIEQWWLSPVERGKPERNELVIKLALAAAQPTIAVADVVQRQRVESMVALRDYTRLKAQALHDDDFAWCLVLENLIFAAEAEVRWLDHVEAMVVRREVATSARTASSPAEADGAGRPAQATVSGRVPAAAGEGAGR